MYCCTQGLGHINKCPVSFIYHNLFPLKQSLRDAILCQLYLQLKWQSMLPFGELRQWDLQAPFSFLVVLWVNRARVCFVLIFFFWWATFKMAFFSDVRKNKLKCRLPHSRGSFSPSWIMATITEDMGLGCAYFIKLKVLCSMQNKLVEKELSCMWWISHLHQLSNCRNFLFSRIWKWNWTLVTMHLGHF